MNKKIILSVSALMAVALGVGLAYRPQINQWLEARAEDQAKQARYDAALKQVTTYIDSLPGKSSAVTSWHLTVADPRTAPLAEWDKPGDKPQLMTQIYEQENRKQAGLYTMNLDGTNLQTLLTADEVKGSISFTKNLRPQRSPNGRYVFFNTGLFSQQKGCVLADLKTRQIERFGGDCNFGGWLPDSSKAYVSELVTAYEIDTAAMTISPLPLAVPNPNTPELRKAWFDGNDHAKDKIKRVRLVNNGTQLVVNIKTSYNKSSLQVNAKPTYLSYNVGDWQHYQKENFYPQECIRKDYIYWREDGGAFSCNTAAGYRGYNANDLSQSALLADNTRYPLQLGVLSGHEDVTPRFGRQRQPDESSPIDTLRYFYKLPNPRDKIYGFSLYVPPAISSGFNHYNLVQQLPALPSHNQYKAAFANHNQDKLEKCELLWQTPSDSKWTRRDFHDCKRVCQIERVGSHFISADCQPTKEKRRG
ncbi:hypothetical protein [Vibrio neptunius]|uniref:Uncharacterized protein n=1 Tax=Vibrio neptunius TaxID=170651 RepID=A0ABS2ZZ50_9VIBR|nr:hypothetical protein [Vibrio neptunius]MBN3492385.1 hypothetical protein [Vibrio neptunius]MBN3514800.1 hypothetical protein [Vibrio neptunius]MBN3549765.1 hypothetical protein [Vibrio neptunius]MBN3577010.1 hypothetical protein [Vibrio neptunius]MCH9870674.1 hypothetical protein [Vibrio neptunius]